MKHLYTILFSLVLIACGNSEKKNETKPSEPLNPNEIFLSQSQFTSGKMQYG